MNIKEIVKNNIDGFSIDLNTMSLINYDNGYIVAITDNKTSDENLETDFKKLLIMSTMLNFDKEKLVIGGWREGLDFYLDLSLWGESKEEALIIAKTFNQKAIYDNKNKDIIEVLK